MKEKTRKIVSCFAMFLCPVFMYYLMEAFHMNAFVVTRWRAQILNIICFEFIQLFLFALIGNLKISLAIETILALLIGLSNYYVLSFRSTPIVPWDIFSVRTAISVAENYDYTLAARQIWTIIGFLVLLVLEQVFVKLKIEKGRLLRRFFALMSVAVVMTGLVKMLQSDTWVSKFHLYPFLFTPTYMSQADGFTVTFLMDLKYLSVDKPQGYDKDEAKEFLKKYEKTKTKETGNEMQKPNIIVIMDEAFSDLGVLGDFTTNEDYMPFVHRLQQGADNTITGYLNVSVKGGNTANTEFEFLTGNSMAFLPAGSIPYQQYIKGEIPSLASYLSGLGYDTYAMHPYYATGWERDKVYPDLGFKNMYFIDDFYGASYLRKYVDDASAMDKIVDTYEKKKKGTPMFLFEVTMQNHGAYDERYSNFTPDISVDGVPYEAVSQYFSLIRRSDQALESLVSYFEQVEEPTVIVFFGDHQPNDAIAAPILSFGGKNVDELTKEDEAKRYEVPYIIWANYDIREGQKEDTSANYLAAKVLDAAGVPLSDYQNYLLELEEEMPIISTERIVKKDGEEMTFQEAGEDLIMYQKLQYYRLFDYGK